MKFNFYYSFPFWLSFLLISVAFRTFAKKPKTKGVLLLISSSFMLLAIPNFTPLHFSLVLAVTIISFMAGRNLIAGTEPPGSGKNKLVTVSAIIIVLAFLAFFKYRFIQDLITGRLQDPNLGASRFIFMVGVSYFSFKMIHFIIESSKKKIEGPRFLTYINYILYFVPFISGPINRFNHFSSQIVSPTPTDLKTDVKKGAERIVHGLFKKFVLVQILYPHTIGQQGLPLSQLTLVEWIIGLYAYALYFYIDFSGYSDLAIGAARIMGLELPENFNHPFLKKNIRELWMNWHMSLTGWLVEYVYWPIVRKLRNANFFREHPISLSNFGMIITFVLCGMWHGETVNFIIWGAYHGLGISIVNIYQREKRKVRNPLIINYFRSESSRLIGIFLTFNFFAFGQSLFILDLKGIKLLVARILAGF